MAGTTRLIVRWVKLAVSAGVWLADRLHQGALALVGREAPGRAVVLYYHGIVPAERAGFARQLDQLQAHAIPIPADHDAPLQPGKCHAAVTFDDGFISVLENALPELERRGIPAMMFVPSGHIGSHPAWIKKPALLQRQERVMDAAQLRDAAARGLDMGSHTVSHQRLDRLSPAEIEQELGNSRRDLEALLGRPVTVLSFPHGAHTGAVLEEARRQGYRRVYGIQPACIRSRFPGGCVGRVCADPSDWPVEFFLKLQGAYRWLQR